MMQNTHDIQGRILEEVKKLASDITIVKSTTGLITHYQKVQELYEKAAFLKMLEEESIDIHQRKDELEAMIEANPTHDKSDEALEKERQVEAEFEENQAKDGKAEEIISITGEKPLAEKASAALPKTENITENDDSEEAEYVGTLQEQQPELPAEIQEEQQPTAMPEEEEQLSSVEAEENLSAAEVAIAIPEEIGVPEKALVTESELGVEKEDIEEPTAIKEPEYTKGVLFEPEKIRAEEEQELYKAEEEQGAQKVKLASIKGLKPVSIESITNSTAAKEKETEEKTQEEIGTAENTFAPTNTMAAVQTKHFRLDLNDRVAFLKKLFNNDDIEMKYVLERLNEFKNLEDAKEYLSDLYYDKNWKPVDEYAQRLWSLVESRFR